MKPALPTLVVLSVLLAISVAKLGNVRYCRNHVRRCARNRFGELITSRLNVSKNTSDDAAAPATDAPAPDPGDKRRKRSLDTIDSLISDYFGTLHRQKRQEEGDPAPEGGGDAAAGGEGAPPDGRAEGNATGAHDGPQTTTEPPSLPLPPPPIFSLKELEETFYGCLNDMGVSKCKLYMAQRCNWHNGKSTILASYCRKWGIPCKPCQQ